LVDYSNGNLRIPAVALICVLLYLHRRNLKKQRMEDAVDPHKSLDFGLGDDKGGMGKRKSILGMGKDHSKYRQLSMDMNLSSPYLLPPGLQSSRESLHSLAKTLHQNEDPYRPVAQYAGSDTASIRSGLKAHDGSSMYTSSSNRRESASRSHSMATSGTYVASPRQNSFPKSPPPPEPAHMKPSTAIPEDFEASPTLPAKDPFRSPAALTLPDFASIPYPDENPAAATMPTSPVIQDPPAVAQRIARRPLEPQSATIMSADEEPDMAGNDAAHYNASQVPIGQAETSSDYHNRDLTSSPSHHEASNSISHHPVTDPLAFDAQPTLPTLPPVATAIIEEPEGYDTHDYPQMPEGPYGQQEYYEDNFDDRGRNMHRESMNYQQAPQTGLGVPEQDTRRLSVGMRPLPPDEFIESEDPETRANRIRSFYKEYFDDSKPDPMPAMPPMDDQPRGRADYYEDYDQSYYPAEAPYYDPGSNAFVMPYAQPVARRAMTPPPSGSRFPGPRGGPRGPPRGPHHGSIGGMSLPGGRGGPMRPGSAASSNYGPRPGSSVSNAWGRPRAGSAMSGSRFGGGPKKPMPPPPALSTLPNPSKLRDDSFVFLNATDFAPPETIKDRVAGRPQSPAGGERRPYQLNVPVHSPLVNAFEELSVLPSP